MLTLLLPVSRAAESSGLVRRLVDSGEIYHPLAWSPREAYEFLRDIPVLESSGLTVRVPDWWNARKPARPTVNVKVNTKGATGIDVDALLDFSVGVSLGGETLGEDEIARLLESSGGLIPLRGKWIEVDPEKLKQALEHWKEVERDVHREGISFFEGMRLLSGADVAHEEAGKDAAAIREWSGLAAGPELDSVLGRLRSPDALQEPAPPGLRGELRPYQRTGYGWLRFLARLGLGACLADDMGLGKTIQVISLLLDLKRDRTKGASLLVVPASLIANWKSELTRFAPELAFAVVHPSEAGNSAAEVGADDADRFDLVVTTYGMLVPHGVDPAAPLAAGDPGRGAGDQEFRHPADAGGEGVDRQGTDRHDRHAGRESPVGPLVALRLPQPRFAGLGQAVRLVRQAVAGRARARRSNPCGNSCGPTSCGGSRPTGA